MILNVARKELKSVFASPMGWIILALLMFAFGTYFLNGVNDYFEVMSGAIRPAERYGCAARAKRRDAQQRRRTGDAIDQPRKRHLLDPRTQDGDRLADKIEAVIAVRQRPHRMRPVAG